MYTVMKVLLHWSLNHNFLTSMLATLCDASNDLLTDIFCSPSTLAEDQQNNITLINDLFADSISVGSIYSKLKYVPTYP